MMTPWSARLRTELSMRAAKYATEAGVSSYQTAPKSKRPTETNDAPRADDQINHESGVTLFPASVNGETHGNFHPDSYLAIKGAEDWRSRLKKAHTHRRGFPAEYRSTACELDSCNSSDALLMNVFCYPGAVSDEILSLLGIAVGARPSFGVRVGVPLVSESDRAPQVDRTEVDMCIGNAQVESKLTESDFTAVQPKELEKYVGYSTVFDERALPTAMLVPKRAGALKGSSQGSRPQPVLHVLGYQLVRNVLAIAQQPALTFRVILDARRPDLLHEWWGVHAAIRDIEVRTRCGFVLWQEIAAAVPAPLQRFLSAKYGL